MSKAILGTKLGMSQVFAENGDLIPVSVIEVLPNVVAAVKTVESDGYNAVQLGYGAVKEKHLTKPVKGQFEKAGIDPVKYLREYRLAEKPSYTVGQTLAADIFAEGEIIDVIGTSRGKGFAGTIKRHNHQRGPESHGSKNHRQTASLGARMSGGGGKVFILIQNACSATNMPTFALGAVTPATHRHTPQRGHDLISCHVIPPLTE